MVLNTSNKITKNEALQILRRNGISCYGNVTFSSLNKTTPSYWANPKFTYLERPWTLILNDWVRRKLYVFQIPANSISADELVSRGDLDNSHLIDIQIEYNNANFRERRSGYFFKKYLCSEIEY